MDYTFEIKNSKKERVACQTITSSTKAKILARVNELVIANPTLKGNGYTCTITSFDWQKGKRILGTFTL